MKALSRAAVAFALAGAALAGCGQDAVNTRVAPSGLSQPRMIERSSEAVVQLLVAAGDNRYSGTGFVIDPRGYVLTAAHVLDGATRITAKMHDGTRLAAQAWGVLASRDVALVKLESPGKDLVSLPLGTDAPPPPNTDALMLNYGGNAQKWARTSLNLSRLSVSVSEAKNLMIGSDQAIYERVTQYGGDMRAGGSGAPIQNPLTGEVTGMFVTGNAESTVGYALPADMLRRELPTLLSGTRKTYIGMQARNVAEVDLTPYYGYFWSADDAAYYAEKVQKMLRRTLQNGLFVESTAAGRPAGKAGIDFGAVVSTVNGTRVKTMRELYRILESADAGDVIKFEGVTLNFGYGNWWTSHTWKVRLTK